jgi:hypothetical protein
MSSQAAFATWKKMINKCIQRSSVMHEAVYYKVTSFGPFSVPSSDLYTRTIKKKLYKLLVYLGERDFFHYTDV